MKPRHAAALALVGWYLLLPPVLPHSGPAGLVPSKQLVDLRAPIVMWEQWRAFDSASACEKEKTRMFRLDSHPGAPDIMVEQSVQFVFGRCVSTDDPRLKPVDLR
jgi:hypothetical protein